MGREGVRGLWISYLFTAFWASMRLPARKVNVPRMARYLRVWNMLRWVQYTYIRPSMAAQANNNNKNSQVVHLLDITGSNTQSEQREQFMTRDN